MTIKEFAGHKKWCPICHSASVNVFVQIEEVPVHCNILWRTREQAIAAPRGDIQLAFCSDCGHIFNQVFDANLVEYSQAYENSLYFSTRFREYARSLASSLVERYTLYGKDIIEIGCGKGEFLVMLCEMGGNRGVGFDPSYVPERMEDIDEKRITFIQDFYSERYVKHEADFICCRHVLEHFEHPYEFIRNLRSTIDSSLDTVVFFEVPNVMYTIRELGIWDLIYEHFSYFSMSSLARLFTNCGFEVRNIREAFGGQFLLVESVPAKISHDGGNDYSEYIQSIATDVAAFADIYHKSIEAWQRELERFTTAGKKAVVWGAGSKGVTFVNTVKIHDQIDIMVDINPYKHGNYVAGTGQRIEPPQSLKNYDPDIIILMNPIYKDEVRKITREINVSADIQEA